MTQQSTSNKNAAIAKIILVLFLLVGCGSIAGYVISQNKIPDYIGHELEDAELEDVINRNSPLIEYAFLSPNADFPRNSKIDTITIHHTGGELSLEYVGELFSRPDRQASSNYGIDKNGRIGMFVEESNRSWATGSSEYDNKAVTIEVANDETGGEWHVSDESYDALIDLIVDICKRNDIESLNYTGDETGNLIAHRMIDNNTQCPGDYLMSRMEDIASNVNKRLADGE